MSEIRNCMVSGTPQDMALWHQICDELEQKKIEWISNLRANGVKAAHPNDGWVDRENNEFKLVYPHFDDGLMIGDLVMLGWPSDPSSYRLVRIVDTRDNMLKNGRLIYKFIDEK